MSFPAIREKHMPNTLLWRCLVATLILSSFGPHNLHAQTRKLEITQVGIGLPKAQERSELSQEAFLNSFMAVKDKWCPLYLQLQLLEAIDTPLRLVIESSDDNELRTTIGYPLGSLAGRNAGEKFTQANFSIVPLVKIPSYVRSITVKIVSDQPGIRPELLGEPFRITFLNLTSAETYKIVSLGSKLPGFGLPGDDDEQDAADRRGVWRNGKVLQTAIEAIEELPDHWLGYDSIDLAVLPTGTADSTFAETLFDPAANGSVQRKREALLEWVRRGGRLIISAGANAEKLAKLSPFQEILPASINTDEPTEAVNSLPLRWQVYGGRPQNELLRSRADPFPVAQLKIDSAYPPRFMIPRPNEAGELDPELAALPAVVQKPFGLGRVTLVTFDLDIAPFLSFPARLEFWNWLLRYAGSERASLNTSGERDWLYDRNSGVADLFRYKLDEFEGVPVISFGWIVLFIFLYALLIGPAEYILLKHVFGRLELTWITFPIIVLSVTAIAYFTAYAFKGTDLRTNKIDLVEVDPASGRVYGSSWFSFFSPRIDKFTIGIEPNPGWTTAQEESAELSANLDWLPGGGANASNIISQGYNYVNGEDGREVALGLESVPMQVWSTKAFTANWTGTLDTNRPLVESRLYHPSGDKTLLQGSFVCNLPTAQLKEAVLLYGGRAYRVGSQGTIAAGQTVTPILDNSTELTEWFNPPGFVMGNQPGQIDINAVRDFPFWYVGFHERILQRNVELQNSLYRRFDQSWRVSDRAEDVYRGQAVLVGQIALSSANGEELMTAPNGASPTTVWTDGLPTEGKPRTPLPGSLSQATFVRVYLPVANRPPQK